MDSRAETLLGWLLPAILITFLGLYATSIRAGLEPEMALLQSGAAGALLAGVARVAVAVVSVRPDPTRTQTELIGAIDEAKEHLATTPMENPTDEGDERDQPANKETEAVSG